MAKENESELLRYKDFYLDQLVFELRFIWGDNFFINLRPFISEFQKELDEKLVLVQDDEPVVFNYKNKFEISIASDRFAVAAIKPNPDIKEFRKISESLYKICVKFAEIEFISRAGLRAFYAKDFSGPQMVADALCKTGYINFPSNLYLIESGKPIIPAYVIGWQNEEKGISYRLRGKSERVGVNLPIQLLAEKDIPKDVGKIYNQVLLDIDIFLVKSALPGQFFASDWIEQANKTAQGELKKFFGE